MLGLFAATHDDDRTRARSFLERAVEVRPDWTPARFHLAALFAIDGDDARAARLLDAVPDHLRTSLDFVVALVRQRSRKPLIFLDGFHLLRHALEACTVEGLVVELGVRRGTSIDFIAAHVGDRAVHGFDSFQGLPSEWGARAKGAYTTHGELPAVRDNVVLHAGWFADTLPTFVAAHREPIRFVNVDCDLYASTREALDAFAPQLVDGTVLVFDEFLCNPGWQEEEHRALVESAADHGFDFEVVSCSLFTRQVGVRIRRATQR